jgi:hypothetical protein
MHVSAGLVLLAMAACSSGGGDGGTPPTNEAPVLKFMTTAIAVPKGPAQSDLTVEASDADGDPLTITWEITRGTLAPQNTLNTVMRWAPPATAGTDTVTIHASDGTATRSITAVIKAGTPFTAGAAPGTFFKINSPYILTPNAIDPKVTIGANAVTNIEPGTELLINTPNAFFNVLGDFEAHGSVDEPIVIRPNNRTFKCGDDRGWWVGITAATDDAFEYVQIWDAKWGIRLFNNSNATLRDCKVLCSGQAGVLIEGNGWLRAIDTRITDGANDGIAIAAVSSLPDSVRIEGCNISYNGNAGIRMDLNDIASVVPIIVEFNQIEFNGSHGISLANSVFPTIHYNAFKGNGDNTVSNLFLTSGYPDPVDFPELNAACNFWGAPASGQATIDLSIRDSLDTSAVHTRVKSSPWLNASPITTPPVCTP